MKGKTHKKRTATFRGFRELMLFNPDERAWLYGNFSQEEVQEYFKEGWKIHR